MEEIIYKRRIYESGQKAAYHRFYLENQRKTELMQLMVN